MDNKKFEQLIDLIINENEEQARALFHDIVVEKSREIYESMMDEDDMMSNNPAGPVQDLLDEIGSEEHGMAEGEDEEFDIEDMDDDGEETVDIEMDSEEDGEEGLEDRVVDLEDKLDQLMAEFEEIMGGDDMGDESDAEFDDEAEEAGSDLTKDLEDGNDEDPMMEAITLKKISVTHGDNGAYTTSPGLKNSGQAGMDSKPVKFSGQSEAVPTGPKGPSNAYAKGETSVKGAGSFKNAPAQNNADLTSAPKPVTKDEAGKVRSPVAESRKAPAKRRI
jgi:polyhydroxyalkanoate synthesis regulator phasin